MHFLKFIFATLLGINLILIVGFQVPVQAQENTGGNANLGLEFCNPNAASNKDKEPIDVVNNCIRNLIIFLVVTAIIVAIVKIILDGMGVMNEEGRESNPIITLRNAVIGIVLIAAPIAIIATFNSANLDISGLSSLSGLNIFEGEETKSSKIDKDYCKYVAKQEDCNELNPLAGFPNEGPTKGDSVEICVRFKLSADGYISLFEGATPSKSEEERKKLNDNNFVIDNYIKPCYDQVTKSINNWIKSEKEVKLQYINGSFDSWVAIERVSDFEDGSRTIDQAIENARKVQDKLNNYKTVCSELDNQDEKNTCNNNAKIRSDYLSSLLNQLQQDKEENGGDTAFSTITISKDLTKLLIDQSGKVKSKLESVSQDFENCKLYNVSFTFYKDDKEVDAVTYEIEMPNCNSLETFKLYENKKIENLTQYPSIPAVKISLVNKML